MYNLYNRIKQLCDSKQISIAAMSNAVGIGRSLLTELKAGRTKTLGIDKIASIARYFGVPIKFFLDEPPFDVWEDIDEDRNALLHYMFIPTKAFKELAGVENINELSLIDYINFIDTTIERIRLTEDGDFDITVKPIVEAHKGSGKTSAKAVNKKGPDISELDPDIRRIARARENMGELDRRRMMKILELSFEKYFNNDTDDIYE